MIQPTPKNTYLCPEPSTRLRNAMSDLGIVRIEDLALIREEDLSGLINVGSITVKEAKARLARLGLAFRGSILPRLQPPFVTVADCGHCFEDVGETNV